MDEEIKSKLSQIQMERMELKSVLNQISYLMKVKPDKNLTVEADRILDRLIYLDIIENEIRKRL